MVDNLCLFCSKLSVCKPKDTKGCRDIKVEGTFVCPFTHKFQHIGSCIRRVEKPYNRNRICNKDCYIYQQREIILRLKDMKLVKLEKKCR